MFEDTNMKAVSAEVMGTFFLVFIGISAFSTLGGGFGGGPGAAGQFQQRLTAIQQNALDESQNVQRGEQVTWPERTWITSMPYMGLIRQT